MEKRDIHRAERLAEELSGADWSVTVLQSVDSTNKYLKALAREGAPHKTVILSEGQTAGHGRFDRVFHSPSHCGIYMSLLLRPNLRADEGLFITAAAAVAVCRAVETLTNKAPQIKWVNDILLKGKKLCGILTEGSVGKNGLLKWAVVGIGINAYPPKEGFDPEIETIATAVFDDLIEGGRDRLAAKVLTEFDEILKSFSEREFLKEYKDRSCLLGKEITVLKNDFSLSATALDITDTCKLLVKYQNGQTDLLNSGEISIKL